MYPMSHVGVRVKNMQVSTEFYCKVLECTVTGSLENEIRKIVFLKAGNSVIELIHKFEDNEKRSAGPVDHIAFAVENLEREIERLKNLGVQIIGDIIQVTERMRVIFFEGPDGERLEFVEQK